MSKRKKDPQPVEALDLSWRAVRALTGAGISDVATLAMKQDEDLAALPGIGALTLMEIRKQVPAPSPRVDRPADSPAAWMAIERTVRGVYERDRRSRTATASKSKDPQQPENDEAGRPNHLGRVWQRVRIPAAVYQAEKDLHAAVRHQFMALHSDDPDQVWDLTVSALIAGRLNYALDHIDAWMHSIPNDPRREKGAGPRDLVKITVTWSPETADRLAETMAAIEPDWIAARQAEVPGRYSLARGPFLAAALTWVGTAPETADRWLPLVENDGRLLEPNRNAVRIRRRDR